MQAFKQVAEYDYVAPSVLVSNGYGNGYAGSYANSPLPEIKKKTNRPPQIKEVPLKQTEAFVSPMTLLKALLCLVLIGSILIASIFLSAVASEIKCSINELNKSSVLLEDEIALLNVKIESANAIDQIEDYATGKLGMRYPRENQCVYFESSVAKPQGLANLIKEKAYN